MERPKPGDTEDDLLAMHREFMRSQGKPSAKAVRVSESKAGEVRS